MVQTNPSDRPTQRQLAYLRTLATRAGQTFSYPQTKAQASAEIRRLKDAVETGWSVDEVENERDARRANDDLPFAIHDFEVEGYGASATWSQRS
jgi:hypothetical protein